MASKEMIKYVKEHIAAGFSVEDIKLELVKHGHPVADVEAALSEIPAQKKEKPKSSSLLKFLVLLTVVIAVGIVLFFVLTKIKTEELKAPELKEEIIPPAVPPSPEAAPEVLPEEVPPYVPPEEIPAEEEKAPEALPPEAAPKGREIPIYDVSRLDFNLTPRLEVIQGVSLQNPDAAVAMCADFNTNAERDVCFATIARSIPDSNQCSRIIEQIMRDQCYLTFAVSGTDTCAKINDSVTKETCIRIISLNLSRVLP